MTTGKRIAAGCARGIFGAACAMLLAPAVAGAQDVTVVNAAHVSPVLLARVERAVQRQVNVDLHRFWHRAPRIRFVASGARAWRVVLDPDRVYCSRLLGCHAALDDGLDLGWHSCWVPLTDSPRFPSCGADQTTTFAIGATIGVDNIPADWEVTFSHELLEMAIDPYQRTFAPGTIAPMEICDPFEQFSYTRNGVTLSDFATPAFFGIGHGQRQDFLGEF